MLKDEQNSAPKAFLHSFAVELDSAKSEESKSITLIGRGPLNNVRPRPYLELNERPAEARLILIVRGKREY